MNKITKLKNQLINIRNNSTTTNKNEIIINSKDFKPDLSDLEKLRPNRLEKYLPSINSSYYLHQLKLTSNQINRAFSKNQLVQICQSIQAQQQQQRQNLTNSNYKSSTKQDLISFILFNHWSLTHPDQIKTNHSFKDLVSNFKSNQQSEKLPHHELFLIYLDHHIKSKKNQTSFIDKITKNLNLQIQFQIDHLNQTQLTILGQLKDRQIFWIEFQKNRKSIFKFQIHLPKSTDLGFQFNPSLLKSLSEISCCYLELLNPIPNQKQILVAYSFDQNYSTERILKEIERYSISSKEHGNLPILIDLAQLNLNPNPLSLSSSSPIQQALSKDSTTNARDDSKYLFAFLPFHYPLRLDWHLNRLDVDNQEQNLSRLVSPSKLHEDIHSVPPKSNSENVLHHHQALQKSSLTRFLKLISSRSLYLLNRPGCESVDVQQWIRNSFPVIDKSNERIECNVYDGYYLKSTEAKSESSSNQKLIQNPFGYDSDDSLNAKSTPDFDSDSNKNLINHLQSIWSSYFNLDSALVKSNQSSHHQKFKFLPKSEHPMSPKLNKFKEIHKKLEEIEANELEEYEEQVITEVYSLFTLNQKDNNLNFGLSDFDHSSEEINISFQVTKRERNKNNTHRPNSHTGEDNYQIAKIEKVWKKQLIILKPHEPTDIMIEVSKRKDVTSEILLKLQTETEEIAKTMGKVDDTKEQASNLENLLCEETNQLNDKILSSHQNQDQTKFIDKSEAKGNQEETHDIIDEISVQSNLDRFLNRLLLINKFKTRQVEYKRLSENELSTAFSSIEQDREQAGFLRHGSAFKIVERRTVCPDHQLERSVKVLNCQSN